MQYLLLVYDNAQVWADMSKADADRVIAEYHQLNADLKASGQLCATDPLQGTSTAKTVRVRGGKLQMTDGPFAETKEYLGGYYVIEARDRDEAEAIAARIPSARYGSIEVRPIAVFDMPA